MPQKLSFSVCFFKFMLKPVEIWNKNNLKYTLRFRIFISSTYHISSHLHLILQTFSFAISSFCDCRVFSVTMKESYFSRKYVQGKLRECCFYIWLKSLWIKHFSRKTRLVLFMIFVRLYSILFWKTCENAISTKNIWILYRSKSIGIAQSLVVF